MSSSNSPCAACKFLRRKCTQECVFAPYFPPDQPQRFSSVHKVFGASNVAKLLNELPNEQREDAVNSLAYEAEARLRDPVYGCVGMISILQQHLKKVQGDIYSAKKELSTYIGPSALLPMIQLPFPNPNLSPAAVLQQHYNMSPLMAIPSSAGPSIAGPSHAGPSNVGPSHAAAAGGSHLMIRDPQPQQQLQPQNQQYLDAQQLAALAVTDQQQQQQQHQQQLRFHGSGVGGYEGTVVVAGGSSVSGGGGGGFNQAGSTSVGALLPSSALGAPSPFDQTGFDHEQQIQPQQHQQQQPQQSPELQDGSLGRLLLLQQPATPQQQQLGHGDIAVAQGTTHHHEQNHHQQQQGSRSQSHHHQNLLLQLQHQREHIQHQQQQQRDDGID